ncbi:MAG: FG-GAP-like repeat-containing protein [Acidobacteriota bacterium]
MTHIGPDVFFRNDGGRFIDATASVGLGKESWSAGCAFFDADGDGDLDLYVSSYVDYALENHKYCGDAKRELRAYCHPDVYGAVADAFFRNDGGRFVDVSAASGIKPTPDGKGLGVDLVEVFSLPFDASGQKVSLEPRGAIPDERAGRRDIKVGVSRRPAGIHHVQRVAARRDDEVAGDNDISRCGRHAAR